MEFNRLPTYGKRYHIIVMMPSLGDEKFIMTLTADTNDYLIDEIVTVPNGKPNPWRYTKKLPSILRMYGIRVTRLPYRSGYYYHTRATYFNSYQRYVYIIIKAFKNRGKILAHKARRGIKILLPKSMSCNPMLTLPFCKNPDEPIDVSPRSHLQFFAELGDECDNLEYDHVDWNFYDLRETYLVGHAGISKGLVLKIPPYKVQFKYNPRLCYVRMVAPQVEPRIRGNMNRKANFAREIVMDASRSRDRSRARTEDDSRIFLWGCVSVDDPKNKYCRPKMSTSEYTVALNVIDSNVPYPLFKLTLPSTNELHVSICDYLDMCIDVGLKVTVLKTKKIGEYNENNTLKHLSDVKNYISEVPYLLSRGRWNKAYVKTLVAIQKIETSAEGIYVYEYLDRGTIITGAQLEQLSVLACQVVERLMPMDYKEAAMVAQIFARMSVVFEQIIQDIEWLHRAAYNALTEHHVFFVSTLALPTEKHPPAQCKTHDEICKMGQSLGAERKFEMDVDPATLIRINWWLLETWYLYKCVYYLGVLGTKRHHPYDRALSTFQGGISYQMNVTEVTEPIENITVNTVDDMFHVHISAGLLGELRNLLADPAVLFQIISQQNFHNMYWWYPEPLPSETNVLIVHAYSPKKNYPMGARLPLKNPLNYYLNISKFSANPEFVKWMTNSTIESHSHIHVYKIPLRSKSVLAVRIGHVTEEILIFMSLNQKPKMHDIREKACHITPNMKGKRIWMTNNCPGTSIAYVGVLSREHKLEDDQNDNRHRKPSKVKNLIENGLNYSILLESYLCTFWLNRSLNPGWSTEYCKTKLENRDDIFVGCTCTILGSLAARIFPVAAERIITVFVFPILETNWYMFALFAMLLLLLLVVLLTYIGRMVAHQHRRVQQCRKKHVRFREDMKFDSEKAILVLIKTGGHEFAGTTSNIKLYFKSNKSSQSSYIVSQDPARPRLLRNSINKINLPAGSVQIPTRLAFGIDRNGRYPRWYCRSVSVVDLENDMEQLFIVERWIEEGHTPFIHSPYFTNSKNARPVQSWTRRFRNSFEQRFINWFLISPMTGPWLSRNTLYTMTRFERSCVWICNVSLTILLVSLYFGPSPYEPITEESFKDDKTGLKMKEVLILGVYSVVIGISVLLFFEFAIMRCLWRRH
ncbi:GL25753 [Drosophila persimilis]|uniref:GL25753 n=1 Tax=Drosophila persimilis TaxID=7234 RepID=B4GK33_DROPE|nr:GL25753 [Drosophila persimilis]